MDSGGASHPFMRRQGSKVSRAFFFAYDTLWLPCWLLHLHPRAKNKIAERFQHDDRFPPKLLTIRIIIHASRRTPRQRARS